MTTSNHRPFTYPDGRIDIPSPGQRQGGVKYADFAIGQFIEAAKTKPWFDNTIFLFVADHCASSAGKTKIPVYRYHIPAIVYAPKILSPQRVDTLASQIDLGPTLLAMLGLEGDDRFVGRDILQMRPEEGRALISTYQNIGYLKGDVLTVLQPKRKIDTYHVSADGKEAQALPNDPQLTREAIAYFQGAVMLMELHGANTPSQ
jgi:phosphoglycerol transferase MdoB-like AlkP superfamily enzyme